MWVSRTHVAPKGGHTCCCTPTTITTHTNGNNKERQQKCERQKKQATINKNNTTKIRKQTLAPFWFLLPFSSSRPRVNQPGRPNKRQEVGRGHATENASTPHISGQPAPPAAVDPGLKRTWENMPHSHTKRAPPAGRRCHATPFIPSLPPLLGECFVVLLDWSPCFCSPFSYHHPNHTLHTRHTHRLTTTAPAALLARPFFALS